MDALQEATTGTEPATRRALTVTRRGDRLLAVKTVDNDTGAIDLEASMLRRLAHPGLVDLIDVTQSGDRRAMRTLYLGPDTWLSAPPPLATRAALFASVAATIADLHELGVRHGSVAAEHVLLPNEGPPRLCSLASAADDDGTGLQSDLDGLAALIDMDTDVDRELLAVAGDLRSGRLTARAAARRADEIGRATGTGPGTHRTRRPSRLTPRTARAAIAGAAAIAAALTITAGIVTRPAGGPDETLGDPGPAAAEPTSAADVPIAGATVVAHDGRLYGAGQPGDLVVLGDWDCDTIPTPAVVRPTSGEVALFATWPAPDETAHAQPRWQLTDRPVELGLDDTGPCDRLRVITAQGSVLLDPHVEQ